MYACIYAYTFLVNVCMHHCMYIHFLLIHVCIVARIYIYCSYMCLYLYNLLLAVTALDRELRQLRQAEVTFAGGGGGSGGGGGDTIYSQPHLERGTRVTIQGLRKAEHLNGRSAVVKDAAASAEGPGGMQKVCFPLALSVALPPPGPLACVKHAQEAFR